MHTDLGLLWIAAGLTSNTACSTCATCAPGQYKTGGCSGTSNTACSTCATCASGQYKTGGCSGTSNTACSTCATCAPGQYTTGGCSGASNTACQPCKQCRNGAEFYVSRCTTNADAQCRAHKSCASTEHRIAAGTLDADTQCNTLTQCGPGKFVATPATKTTDQVCGACNATATYTDKPNLPTCKEKAWCSYGEHVTVVGTAATDLQCGNCHASQDEFQNILKHRAATCQTMRLCPAGEYAAKESIIEGRVCEPCPIGRYMAAVGHTEQECVTHPTYNLCRIGTQLVNVSSTSQGVCEVCSSGMFRATDGAKDRCITQTACTRNQYVNVGGSSSADRVCAPCPTGQFMPRDNHTEAGCASGGGSGATAAGTEAPTTTTQPPSHASKSNTTDLPGPDRGSSGSEAGDGDGDGGGGGGVVTGVAVALVLLAVIGTIAAVMHYRLGYWKQDNAEQTHNRNRKRGKRGTANRPVARETPESRRSISNSTYDYGDAYGDPNSDQMVEMHTWQYNGVGNVPAEDTTKYADGTHFDDTSVPYGQSVPVSMTRAGMEESYEAVSSGAAEPYTLKMYGTHLPDMPPTIYRAIGPMNDMNPKPMDTASALRAQLSANLGIPAASLDIYTSDNADLYDADGGTAADLGNDDANNGAPSMRTGVGNGAARDGAVDTYSGESDEGVVSDSESDSDAEI